MCHKSQLKIDVIIPISKAKEDESREMQRFTKVHSTRAKKKISTYGSPKAKYHVTSPSNSRVNIAQKILGQILQSFS